MGSEMERVGVTPTLRAKDGFQTPVSRPPEPWPVD